MNAIINLQKLTAPAAIIIASAWVSISNGIRDGILFLIAVAVFYVIIVLLEHAIYVDNVSNGRYRY